MSSFWPAAPVRRLYGACDGKSFWRLYVSIWRLYVSAREAPVACPIEISLEVRDLSENV